MGPRTLYLSLCCSPTHKWYVCTHYHFQPHTLCRRYDGSDAGWWHAADDLAKIDAWHCANKLSLNLEKNSYLVFTYRSKANISPIVIRNSISKPGACAKFLGVLVDYKLAFFITFPFDLPKGLEILWGVAAPCVYCPWCCDTQVVTVYTYLVHRVAVWGGAAECHLLGWSFCRLVVWIWRCRTRNYLRNHCAPCWSGWISLYYQLFCLSYVSPILRDRTKLVLFERFGGQRCNHSYGTRFALYEHLCTPAVNLTTCFTLFLCLGFQFWNEIPQNAQS